MHCTAVKQERQPSGMSGSRRKEREVVAIAFNHKEQRVLEKSLSTLKLEASYSLKLLDLHNRTVKVQYRHMKDRVARIKSYLNPDQIHELRVLEAEGKLQPMYPAVSLGSALKIAAAARRLNSTSCPHRPPRAKSAFPRVNVPDKDPPHAGDKSTLQPRPGSLKRSNSVTGVFIDVPQNLGGHSRPGSASRVMGESSSSSSSSRPGTSYSNSGGGSRGVTGNGAALASQVGGGGGGNTLSTSRPGTGLSSAGGGSYRGMNGHHGRQSPSNLKQSGGERSGIEGRAGSGGGGEGSGFDSSRPGSQGPARVTLNVQRQNVTGGSVTKSSSRDEPHQPFSRLASGDARNTTQDGHQAARRAGTSQTSKTTSTTTTTMVNNGHHHQGNKHVTMSRKPSAVISTTSSFSTPHPHTPHPQHAPFSSHVATEKEARDNGHGNGGGSGGGGSLMMNTTTSTPRAHSLLERRSSLHFSLQDDTVDDLGEDLCAERRAELLEQEQYRAADIGRRKDRFLQEIDQYLREHPPLSAPPPRTLPISTNSSDDKALTGTRGGGGGDGDGDPFGNSPLLYRRRRVEFDSNPTHLPEEDYRDKLMGLWRGMSKCRYLRVPDAMIDLSGINTLAADTMRLFQVLRHQGEPVVGNAWTE